MTWRQKIAVLFLGSMSIGIAPVFITAYANYLLAPGECWPDIYGYYILLPVGLMCMGACFWSLNWIEDRLNICGHKETEGE